MTSNQIQNNENTDKEIKEDCKYFQQALSYYIYLEDGSEEDFKNEIKEYGFDYFRFYYDRSQENTLFLSKINQQKGDIVT